MIKNKKHIFKIENDKIFMLYEAGHGQVFFIYREGTNEIPNHVLIELVDIEFAKTWDGLYRLSHNGNLYFVGGNEQRAFFDWPINDSEIGLQVLDILTNGIPNVGVVDAINRPVKLDSHLNPKI